MILPLVENLCNSFVWADILCYFIFHHQQERASEKKLVPKNNFVLSTCYE